MLLKRMFYASASILMLALAYHLGAQNAVAQGQLLEGPKAGGTWTASVNRSLWVLDGVGSRQVGPPIPGTAAVIATDGGGSGPGGPGFAMLANGDCYYLPAGGSDWQLYGNLLGGGTTPSNSSSFGALKVKYR